MKFSIFLLFLSVLACKVYSQDVDQLMLYNQQNITKLSKYLKTDNSELFKGSQEVSRLLGSFSKKLANSNSKNTSYATLLINYNKLLEKSLNDKDPTFTKAMLSYISEDINLKFNENPGLDENLASKVLVRIRVVNNDNIDQSGYEVEAKFYLTIDDVFAEKFNPTNNAEKQILPGWYMFRIKKNNINVDERSEHIVSGHDNLIIFNISK